MLTKLQQNRFKPDVARKWVELVYEGFYHDPLKTDIEAFLKSSQAKVNGEVVLETRGGRVDAVAVKRRTCSTPRVPPTRSRPTGAWRRLEASSSCSV